MFKWRVHLKLNISAQMNVTSDIMEAIPCEDIVPNDRVDWERIHCVGVDAKFKNHRVVVDGEGSETVYNGHEFKTDLRYTRANRYVSGVWRNSLIYIEITMWQFPMILLV